MSSKDVILIWGWVKDDKSYDRFIASTPAGYKIHPVSIEQVAPRGYTEEFTERLEVLLKQKGLDNVILVAHSLGAALALKFAAKHPKRIDRMVVSDAVGLNRERSFLHLMWCLIRSHFQEKGKVEGKHISTVFKLFRKPILLSRFVGLVETIDVSSELGKLEVPYMILWGEKDVVTPLPHGLPGRLVVLEGMDHNWILHSPQLFWENTKGFIDAD